MLNGCHIFGKGSIIFGIDDIQFDLLVDGEKIKIKANEFVLFNTSQIGIIDEHLDLEIHLDDGRL